MLLVTSIFAIQIVLGGHLTLLAIEKIRGRPVDMRKVIPVSAAVAAFFIIFTVAVVYVDLVKPPV